TAYLAAPPAPAHDHPPLAGVVLNADRLEQPVAGVGAVAGSDVHVEGVEATVAVIAARPARERRHFRPAVFAGEAGVPPGRYESPHAPSVTGPPTPACSRRLHPNGLRRSMAAPKADDGAPHR